MDFGWFLAIAGIVAAVAWLDHVRRHRRRRALHAWATRNGLRYAVHDPFGTLRLPFDLFRQGDRRKVENVLYGTVADFDVRLFDYWFYEESSDHEGRRTRSYRRFTCGLARLPGVRCPRIEVAPETVGTRLRGLVGRDLQFESDEFNRAFHVRAEVDRAAYALIDARLMEWLLAAARDHRSEVVGDLLLVSRPQTREVAELWEVLHVVRGFRERVPSVVASLYPDHGAASEPLDRFAVPFVPDVPVDDDSGIVPKWTL